MQIFIPLAVHGPACPQRAAAPRPPPPLRRHPHVLPGVTRPDSPPGPRLCSSHIHSSSVKRAHAQQLSSAVAPWCALARPSPPHPWSTTPPRRAAAVRSPRRVVLHITYVHSCSIRQRPAVSPPLRALCVLRGSRCHFLHHFALRSRASCGSPTLLIMV